MIAFIFAIIMFFVIGHIVFWALGGHKVQAVPLLPRLGMGFGLLWTVAVISIQYGGIPRGRSNCHWNGGVLIWDGPESPPTGNRKLMANVGQISGPAEAPLKWMGPGRWEAREIENVDLGSGGYQIHTPHGLDGDFNCRKDAPPYTMSVGWTGIILFLLWGYRYIKKYLRNDYADITGRPVRTTATAVTTTVAMNTKPTIKTPDLI